MYSAYFIYVINEVLFNLVNDDRTIFRRIL